MNIPTNHHIIEHKGKPVAVVVPYDEYLVKFNHEPTIPDEVVRKVIVENFSLIRAWREYKGYTQEEIAERMGISQPAYQQIEGKTAKPRSVTLQKLANAFGIKEEQLYL